MICAPFDKGVYRFTMPDGEKISFCYQHLLDIIKRNKSLPDIPAKTSDFDLIEFLTKVKQLKNPDKQAMSLLKSFLNKTKLINYLIALEQKN